jgi:hypothetical protein
MRRLLALGQRLLLGVVLVVSGAYLLIYLYRWEWNRAIISGIFFVAAEVALATAMILRRLRALEQRTASPQQPSPPVLERLRSTPVDRPDPFAWLKTHDSRVGVFVPVLLGAGAILSAFAYVVERVGEATALPALDQRLATRLSVLAPPPGGLLGRAPKTTDRSPTRSRPTSVGATMLALAAMAILGWLGIDALVDATQSRPDTSDRPARTTIELSIAQRGAAATSETAEALWVGCRPTLGPRPTTAKVVPLGGDRFQLVLEPGIGHLGARRLTGCLSDLTLDYVRADVVDVENTPPPGG